MKKLSEKIINEVLMNGTVYQLIKIGKRSFNGATYAVNVEFSDRRTAYHPYEEYGDALFFFTFLIKSNEVA